MPLKQVNPAELTGDALRRWYLRSPAEIETERLAAEDERYQAYFGRDAPSQNQASRPAAPTLAGPDEDALWIANGRGGYRKLRPGLSDFQTALEPERSADYPGYLPASAAAAEAGEFVNVGNPHNPRLKQEFIKKNGYWPKTPDGRDYDVSHIRAIGDGGTNTLDNIEPMDPDEHRAKHKRDGDPKRFGKRPGIARAFGGKVEPPAHAPKPARGPTVRGFGLLGLIPNITGLLSGRIRTDSFDNFTNDMLGYPSQEDIRHRKEELRRRYFPNSKPGDLVA